MEVFAPGTAEFGEVADKPSKKNSGKEKSVKKTVSCFNFFKTDEFPKIRKEFHDKQEPFDIGKATRILVERWKNVTEEQKAHYKALMD